MFTREPILNRPANQTPVTVVIFLTTAPGALENQPSEPIQKLTARCSHRTSHDRRHHTHVEQLLHEINITEQIPPSIINDAMCGLTLFPFFTDGYDAVF